MSADSADAQRATDPVCGMRVVPETAPFRSEWRGRTIYFCCEGCKRAFDRKPALYALGDG